jgi:hypothetical protein
MIDLPTANATPEMRVATPGSRHRGLLTDDSLFTVSLSSFYCETLEMGISRSRNLGDRATALFTQSRRPPARHDARAVSAPQSSRAPPTRHHRLIRLQLASNCRDARPPSEQQNENLKKRKSLFLLLMADPAPRQPGGEAESAPPAPP